MANLTISLEEFTALASLARAGAATPDKRRTLETFLKSIEAKNNVKRYVVWVQWQEQDSPVPTSDFPEKWPPEMRVLLERTDRPIAKSDVVTAVDKKASKPTNIMVTKDPGAVVGWTKLEDFFVT